MLYTNGHVDYRVKEDGKDLIGIAKVKLPSLNRKTVTMEGAGFGGEMEVPMAGMLKAMKVEFDFSSVTDSVLKLGDNRWHNVALYEAFQYFDDELEDEYMEQDRIEMSIRAIDDNLGTIATASPADASGSYSCRRIKIYKDGKKVLDVDPLHTKHEVNGVDCNEKLREALGMM